MLLAVLVIFFLQNHPTQIVKYFDYDYTLVMSYFCFMVYAYALLFAEKNKA
jgi:hypothetical protein